MATCGSRVTPGAAPARSDGSPQRGRSRSTPAQVSFHPKASRWVPMETCGSPVPAPMRSGPGLTTADGLFAGGGALAGGSVLALSVAGRGGVSVDAGAVSMNLTATGPNAPGYITVFPCGISRPNASTVNFVAGQVVAN